jgi:ABC-type oligopeptide transport system substrate-binding subunit/class 3 adenylate cyclase
MHCAAPLLLVCSECGTELPPTAKFCFNCAAPVHEGHPEVEAAPGPTAIDEAIHRLVPKEFAERLLATRGQVQRERRMVTILFSDVKGSTAMGETLDPEDVMDIMDGAFDVLIEPIYRYEGTLARLMGDAILAFFGAPIAHEDDPERACRAALEIVEGAREYAAKLARERGIEGFNVRVGINTGLVVVGEVGSDLRVEYTAMGDAINLAARMEGAAEPGTVLISEDTHRLIAPLFETKPLGPIAVKGKAEPVSVHRVLAAKAAPGKVRGIAGLESPLVGREAEFAALREAVERLRVGVGGIATVVGEAGLGKSRLVAELRETGAPGAGATHLRGASHLRWVEGRCLSYGSSIAYLLWLDVLRGLLGVTEEDAPVGVGDALRERVRALCSKRFDDVYPFLARLMSLPLEEGLADKLDGMGGQDLKTQTFGAVEALIGCAASERPLVLVCEDLHWADSISMELLEQVLALVDRVPLLLLCVFRPRKEHASWRLREIAAREYRHRHTDLWLDPLSAAESETLVGNLLRLEALPQGLRARILEHAEGNPFYVEEIIRSLIDRGAIVHDEAMGQWEAAREVAQIPIPDTLHGVLMARIDRLQEDTRRVLQMASVIGRVFLYRILETMAGEEEELDERLLTLQREEMIRERARLPELEYIFKHELTREAAYNGLLKRQRRAFHRQVAGALERLFPERAGEQVGLLAHHWERAEEPDKAVHYLLRAGGQARDLYAHEEAVEYYRRALVLLKELEDHDGAARTLMNLGLTYHNAFEFRQSREAYQEGFALWQEVARQAPAVALPPAPHALRLLDYDDPLGPDPGRVYSWGAGWLMIPQLLRGLVELSPQLEVLPGLARSWEILQDGRRYVFHMEEDAQWSDGEPVTAHDVEFAWKRVLNPATGTPRQHADVLHDIKGAEAYHRGDVSDPDTVGVRALNDATLVVDLESPAGYFLQVLTHVVTFPVPRHVVEAHGEAWAQPENMVTNGPFSLAEWRRGESVLLVRNARFRGARAGNVDSVEIALLLNPTWQERLAMYEADEVDALGMGGFPVEQIDRLRQHRADQFISAPMPITRWLCFDVTRPPLDDARVRRALTLATDREVLARICRMAPATGGFVPPGIPGHSPGIGLPYDPEQARLLLAEAGYPGGRALPILRGLVSDSGFWGGGLADYLEAQWRRELGVEIRWERAGVEYDDRVLREQHDLTAAVWGADYPDPDNFLRVGLRHPNPPQRVEWRDEEYDRLVQQARQMPDQGERMALCRRADRFAVEEAPFLAICYGQTRILLKPWVKRYAYLIVQWSQWKDVIIEPH